MKLLSDLTYFQSILLLVALLIALNIPNIIQAYTPLFFQSTQFGNIKNNRKDVAVGEKVGGLVFFRIPEEPANWDDFYLDLKRR